jgi:hypothetical protein
VGGCFRSNFVEVCFIAGLFPQNMDCYIWQVERCDAAEAVRLLEVALQQSATDHATGKTQHRKASICCAVPSHEVKHAFWGLSPQAQLTWISSQLECLQVSEPDVPI